MKIYAFLHIIISVVFVAYAELQDFIWEMILTLLLESHTFEQTNQQNDVCPAKTQINRSP